MNKKVLIGIGAALVVVVVAVLIGMFYGEGKLLKGGGGYGGWGGGSPLTPEQSPITPKPPTFEAPTNTVTTRAQFSAILIRNLTGKKPSELSQYKGCFPDMIGHVYESYICYFSSKIVPDIGGFDYGEYGNFQPKEHVTRAEAVQYIVKAFGLPLYKVQSLISEVNKLHWAFWYFNTLVRYKIVTPYGGDKYVYPDALLTTQTALDWVTKAKAVKK